jgi:predicted N-acetyltransferase YhbS
MIKIRQETMRDVEAREALLDSCFGAERFLKTCERLREGRVPAQGLSLVVERDDGAIIGTVRLWHVSLGANRPALMLGPIAIDPSCQSLGLGGKLMGDAIGRAKALGHKAVVLVGDAAYYERFGFSTDGTGGLWMPGPYERERFLGLALEAGALDGARGLVSATGDAEPKPDLAALVAAASQGRLGGMALAA